MANFYYQTLGEAWSAIASAFTGAGPLTYLSAGFSVTWVTSAASDGGHFVVAGSVVGGDAYANGSYFARNAKTGAALPLNYILRAPGFSDPVQVASQAFGGALTAATLNTQLQGARQAAIADVTGATLGTATTASLTITGGSTALLLATIAPWVNAGDVGIDLTSVANTTGEPANAQATTPWQPIWPTSQAAQVVNRLVLGQRLDMDVAINDGEAIYTATSNTFTGA